MSRLENDVDSIYEILTDVQSTQARHTATLTAVLATQDVHSVTLAEHSATLAEHGATLAEHTAMHAEHTRRFDRIDETLAEIVRRLPER